MPSHNWSFDPSVRDVLAPNDFPGVQDYVTCVAVDSETDRLLCGSRDCTATVFDLSTGGRIATLQHEDWVNGAVFFESTPQSGNFSGASSHAAAAASPGRDDVKSRRQAAKSFYRSPTVDFSATAGGMSARLIVTAGEDGQLTWWGSKYAAVHRSRLTHAALTKMQIANGCLLVLSLQSVFIVSPSLRTVLRRLRVASEPLSVAPTVDGCTVFCGQLDGQVVIYDLPQSLAVKQFAIAESSPVRAVALDPSNSYAYCGCDEGIVGVWSIGLSQLVRSFAPHRERRVATSLAIYDLAVLQLPIPLPTLGGKTGTSVSGGAQHEVAVVVVTASRDGTIALTRDNAASTAPPQTAASIPLSLKLQTTTVESAMKASNSPTSPTAPSAFGGPAGTESAATTLTVVPFSSMSCCILPVIPTDDSSGLPDYRQMTLIAGEAEGRVVRFRLFPALSYCC